MMVSRMIISLKKAASMQLPTTGVEVPSGLQVFQQDTHSPHLADSIQLSVLKS